jgi:hypothetical protein
MKYICAQPRLLYFAWQIEIMINNFLKNGINGNDIEILIGYNDNEETSSEQNIQIFEKLANKYNYVRFFFYEDTRNNLNYIPSIYFNLVKQHFQQFPELSKETIFFHDCDIIFTKQINLQSFENDNIWYLSDTNSYINSKYILSKGENLYNNMINIVGLNSTIPKLMNSHSGGAQHIIKNTNFEYWDKVEKNAVEIYQYLSKEEINHKPKYENDYSIQKWTAGMWSLLWNAWLFEHETKVIPELNFCMATDYINRWNETSIFHNAGADIQDQHLFRKFQYTNKLPYFENFEYIDKNTCSYNYIKELQQTGLNTCLI